MRHANLEVKGKETGETILIVNPEEGRILVDALQRFCDANRRKTKAAKLLQEMDSLAVF